MFQSHLGLHHTWTLSPPGGGLSTTLTSTTPLSCSKKRNNNRLVSEVHGQQKRSRTQDAQGSLASKNEAAASFCRTEEKLCLAKKIELKQKPARHLAKRAKSKGKKSIKSFH